MIYKCPFLLILVLIWPINAFALDTFLEQSDSHFAAQSYEKADFYLALHIANEIEKPAIEIPKLFQHIEQRGIKPTSFINAKYSRDFLTDFFSASLFQWRSSSVDEQNSVILTEFGIDPSSGHYAVIWGTPRLEKWSIIGTQNSSSYLLGYARAVVVVGQYDEQKNPVPCNSFELSGPLSKVYSPEFHDLNQDGFPELLIKVNTTVADGFIQSLEIFNSTNGSDFCTSEHMKTFEARNGFILNDGGNFSIGVERSLESESVLTASQHEVTRIFFDGKEVKILENTKVPNVFYGTNEKYWQ